MALGRLVEFVEAMPSKVILMMPKNQELSKVSSKDSRIKFQVSRFKNKVSRIKNQESTRIKIKIQDSREELIKISIKKFFQKLSSTWIFLKTCLPKSFYSLVIDY